MRVLIAGVAARAAGESASRAGFDVQTLDAFADLDQHPGVRATLLPRASGLAFSAPAAADAARAVSCDAAAYLSNFENHPRAVSVLAAGRRLLGNPPQVLRRVRDPALLAATLRERGLAAPAIGGAASRIPAAGGATRWLLKPIASGGGSSVRAWAPARPWGGIGTLDSGAAREPAVPRGHYLQERIAGVPGSVVFVAAGGRVALLAVSRQLVGEAAFGARAYRYCGSVVWRPGDRSMGGGAQLAVRLREVAAAVAESFGLVGVNGIDFIVRRGVPWPIEVNPRWCASMELADRAGAPPVFGLHAAACETGSLPTRDLWPDLYSTGCIGKAVVFARHDAMVPDTRAWLGDPHIRDVPHPHERIAAGRPVCTVFASGSHDVACHATLKARAALVFAALERPAVTGRRGDRAAGDQVAR